MFGKGFDSVPLTVGYNQFVKVYNEAGETSLITLVIDDNKTKVLLKELQYHPVSSKIMHAGFHKVDLTEKITADIPVGVVGEDENVLVKNGQALVLTLLNEIRVEALPGDLPSAFNVDVSDLVEIGAGVTVGELHYNKEKVEISGHEDDDVVVKLDYATILEDEEEEQSEEELIEGMEATQEAASTEASEESSEESS